MKMNRKLGLPVLALCLVVGLSFTREQLYAARRSQLPSWMSVSTHDISSISVQGWGPGASGNFVVHPAAGQSRVLINSLVNQLTKDKAIKPYATAVSHGGAEWLDIRLKDGSSIDFASFPNEPRPFQYNVIHVSATGKREASVMISDVSGVVTSAIRAIDSKGAIVRDKSH